MPGEPTTMLPLDELAIVCDVVVDVDDAATDLRYFNESLWDLYSIGVFGGRFSTRRNVSRMRVVQLKSVALRFQIDNRSSYLPPEAEEHIVTWLLSGSEMWPFGKRLQKNGDLAKDEGKHLPEIASTVPRHRSRCRRETVRPAWPCTRSPRPDRCGSCVTE